MLKHITAKPRAAIQKTAPNWMPSLKFNGGRCWIRTSDPIRVKDVLYP